MRPSPLPPERMPQPGQPLPGLTLLERLAQAPTAPGQTPPRGPAVALGMFGLLAGLAAAPGALAAPRVNDSGLTVCFSAEREPMACDGSGQDAELGRDVTHPQSADGALGLRFARVCRSGELAGAGDCPATPEPGPGANHWGCTQDRITGLLWELKTRDRSLHDHRRLYTHYSPVYNPDGHYGSARDAAGLVAAVRAEGLCGRSDWRLPDAPELLGLARLGLDFGQAWMDRRFFPNAQFAVYRAGDADRRTTGPGLDLATTSAPDIGADFRAGLRPVQLVSGTAGPDRGAARWAVAANGHEVQDRHTGLTWRRCAVGQLLNSPDCAGSAREMDYFEALAHAQQVAAATGQAWRLPNVKELASLMDASFEAGVDPAAFPNRPQFNLLSGSMSPLYRVAHCVSQYNTGLCSSTGAVQLVRDTPAGAAPK